MAPNGSQRLPTAPYDYKHTLLLFSSSMTPTDFHLLPPRELTPQPYSQASKQLSQLYLAKCISDNRCNELATRYTEGAANLGDVDAQVRRHPKVNI